MKIEFTDNINKLRIKGNEKEIEKLEPLIGKIIEIVNKITELKKGE